MCSRSSGANVPESLGVGGCVAPSRGAGQTSDSVCPSARSVCYSLLCSWSLSFPGLPSGGVVPVLTPAPLPWVTQPDALKVPFFLQCSLLWLAGRAFSQPPREVWTGAAGPWLGVEAGGLWFVKEASEWEKRTVGSSCSYRISPGGSRPRRGREQSPLPGAPPDPPPQWLRQRQAPVALLPASSISARVWGAGGCPCLPWEPHQPGLVHLAREARWAAKPQGTQSPEASASHPFL